MWRGSATAISRRLFKLLNDQGNREIESMLAYTAYSHWFNHNELPGSASWCKTHAEEERGHAMKIFDHLSSRRIEEAVTGLAGEGGEGGGAGGTSGGTETEAGEAAERKPSLGQLQTEADPQASTTFAWERTLNIVLDVKGPITTTFADPVAIWRSALEQERENSRRFFQIMAAARETQDYVTEHILLTFFIPEQLGEEKAVEEIFSNTVSERWLAGYLDGRGKAIGKTMMASLQHEN
jgi:ferritin